MVTKSKTSKIKRNNQKRNKLVKKGVIKKKPKVIKRQDVPKIVKNDDPVESESDDNGEDMLEMVEEEDLKFLKNAISNKSYTMFNKVRCSGLSNKSKKRKFKHEDDRMEEEYEQQTDEVVKMKNLLPIKTKEGIVTRSVVDETVEEQQSENENLEEEEEESDVEEFTIDDQTELDPSKPITSAELLATRNELLQERKLRIGVLSSSILENPEEKVINLKTLLNIMEEDTPVHLSVCKLVLVSLLEVFKDLLPSYQIKHQESTDVKLKKETLKLQKYENALLLYYKKYLQKLEKFSNILVKKMGDFRKRSDEEKKLGELAINAMCELLVTHPYFNYGQNIAQAVIPFLNHFYSSVRQTVNKTCKEVFKNDKKGEITLKILRIINQYLKNHSHNVNVDMLEVFLVLKLHDVNLDQNKEEEIKQKKFKAQKHKIIQMSKREKKRKKRLEQLEQEMLETKAEENKKQKHQNLTEITKIVFAIYFRILKSSTNTKVLGICLEGLAKFAHCINMEYYIDLVNVLNNLLKEDWLGYREKLHCVQTVFSILSGQGEALNVDPSRFYTGLYKDLLSVNVARYHQDFAVTLEALNSALIKRRKQVTNKRLLGFVKRLATLSLQLNHNSSLSCLSLIKSIMQLNSTVDVLLDLDSSVGDGKYEAELDDPEYCNASSTALFEMVLLNRHYHPVVHKYAKHLAGGAPASGENSLPSQYGKCTPEQLFNEFNPVNMAFNPPVHIPKKVQSKAKIDEVNFADLSFEKYCNDVVKNYMKSQTTVFVE